MAERTEERTEGAREYLRSCELNGAGPDKDGTVWIRLKDSQEPPAFPDSRWYKADYAIKNELLATALVAISSRIKVEADLSSLEPHSVVQGVFPVRGS